MGAGRVGGPCRTPALTLPNSTTPTLRSVGGFEIDIPVWRPQPSEEYEVDAPQAVLDSLGKIENMFGASLRLVSTKDGGWGVVLGHFMCLCGGEWQGPV